MPSSNSEARKRTEKQLRQQRERRDVMFDIAREVWSERTTWGTEEQALDNLRAELAACRAEISRLRGENARLRALIPSSTFRRIPRGSGLPLAYSPHRKPARP